MLLSLIVVPYEAIFFIQQQVLAAEFGLHADSEGQLDLSASCCKHVDEGLLSWLARLLRPEQRSVSTVQSACQALIRIKGSVAEDPALRAKYLRVTGCPGALPMFLPHH